MKRKATAVIVALLALLLVTAVFGYAAGAFQLPWDSAMGGGTGGSKDSSASYTLVGSFTWAIETNDSSTNYQLCSGFICGEFMRYMFLPWISN